ncbi:uncharacterized protein TNCV_1754251 [Trichonephila clavipes]|nr:uncharacterized protein TNCV_1754251 [Trichonephila clavipes]
MIPIYKRLDDSFYLVLVHSQNFADFLTQYILNCPVGTRIEMQGCNQDYSIGKVEFMRTEKGFLYNQEHGDADIEHVLPPEAWLNIAVEQFIIKFPMLKIQAPQLIIHIWITEAFYNRLCYSEFFSTVGYLELKRTLNPQFEEVVYGVEKLKRSQSTASVVYCVESSHGPPHRRGVEEPIVKNKERLICEEHYANTHFRTKGGKYVVSMPLKKEPSCLGNSKDIALKRLGSLWNRLASDKNYLNLYCEFLRDYERLGQMKEVTNETEPEITYYATHHGIYRPEKSTTKLRVVFNCSSLTDNGISLNDIQYNGGVIQEDLYAQMLRFRTYTYAFTADIKMMYRTILINSKQRNLQRIVWCESEHESPKIYELSTVTYGTVSAPYLAQRTLTQLSMDEEANFPIAASVLRNNLYMDDVLCGAATLEEAIVLRQQLKGIFKSAGMELHKLCANQEKLSPDPEQNYNFATLTETKTDVLSTIAKIFDPVGLMAPVISKAKIFLQRLWRSKLEWNDLLPAEEYREWQQFLVSLENINNIEIPRRILVAFPEVIEIHGFADASERCYGAAVYCKSKNLKSETLVRLITSKSRVAPIKSLTIPRLELCAAVLLAKLVKRVVAALQLETAELYLWSDSMIVLAWLRKEPMDLKTFVQNRVAKIQELYPNQLWRHVPSDQNPAVLVSRGVDPDKLLQQNLWFNGPTFLSGDDDYPNREL